MYLLLQATSNAASHYGQVLSFVLSDLILDLDILLSRNSTGCTVYLFQHRETEKPSDFTTVVYNSERDGGDGDGDDDDDGSPTTGHFAGLWQDSNGDDDYQGG